MYSQLQTCTIGTVRAEQTLGGAAALRGVLRISVHARESFLMMTTNDDYGNT
jgi:hypothetical protein